MWIMMPIFLASEFICVMQYGVNGVEQVNIDKKIIKQIKNIYKKTISFFKKSFIKSNIFYDTFLD